MMATETDKSQRALERTGNGRKLAQPDWLSPFVPLAVLRREMDKVFESVFGGQLSLATEGFFGAPRTFSPEVNVKESDKEVKITAELPGLDPKDVSIEVVGADLVLSGEKKEEKEEKDEGWRCVERRYGSFRRLISLGAGIEPEKVTAQYKDGVLTITVPKKPEAQPLRKKVEIR